MKKNIQNIIITFNIILLMSFIACNKEDNTAPIMTLKGDAKVYLQLNSTYTEAGATAIDDKDGDISKSIYIKNEVNKDKVGTYKVVYSVSDKAGNFAPPLTRTVIVYNSSDKFIGKYFVNDYIYFPLVKNTTYTNTLIIDSTINNQLIFTIFSDSIPRQVHFIVSNKHIDFPYQIIKYPNDKDTLTIEGYGSLKLTSSDTIFSINYFKGSAGIISSCKADFRKLHKHGS